MIVEDLLYFLDSTMIKELGFPIVSFLVMIILLIYIIEKDEKRQHKNDQRYDDIVNKFVQSTKSISDQNNSTLKEMTSELKSITLNIERNIEKTEETKEMVGCVREKIEDVKEKVITKSTAYVFREGRINRIKNDKEIDVTRDIIDRIDNNI